MQMVQRNIRLSSTFSLLYLLCFRAGVNGRANGVPPIFARDSEACGTSGLEQCKGDPNLPSNFCCPPDTTCYSLDNSSSMLCCPNGANCSLIQPIVCDLKLQNATANPMAWAKTTKLDDELPTCGHGCCPHGYSCQDEHACKLDIEDAKILSPTATSSAGVTETTTSSQSASSSSTTTSPVSPATSPVSIPGFNQNALTCPEFPGAAIAVGFFPGLAVGVILSIGWFFWSRRYANRSSATPSPQPTSPNTAHVRQRSDGDKLVSISDPIPSAAQDSMRTDFLRHQPDSKEVDNGASSGNDRSQSRVARTGARVRSLFANPKPSGGDAPAMPVTPPSQVHSRDGSGVESVHNYDPTDAGSQAQSNMLHPNQALRASRPPTTFTDMMERVGFQNERGSPFYAVTTPPQPPTGRRGA